MPEAKLIALNQQKILAAMICVGDMPPDEGMTTLAAALANYIVQRTQRLPDGNMAHGTFEFAAIPPSMRNIRVKYEEFGPELP